MRFLVLGLAFIVGCASQRATLVAVRGDRTALVQPLTIDDTGAHSDSLQLFTLAARQRMPPLRISARSGKIDLTVLSRNEYLAALDAWRDRETKRINLREARITFGIESQSAAQFGSGRFAGDEYDVGSGIDELVLERRSERRRAALEAAYQARRSEAQSGYLDVSGATEVPESGGIFAVQIPEEFDRSKTFTVAAVGAGIDEQCEFQFK